MGEMLALASAVCFGVTHFLSALLARRADATAVAFYAQIGGCLLILAAAPMVTADSVTAAALAWGALSGIGTGLGVTCLYRGVGTGRVSVVVPLSDVGALALPVLFGVLLLGERPAAVGWLGIAAALPALWLVSRARDEDGIERFDGVRYGLLAGVGCAVQFIALARVGEAAGLWPLVASRLASVVAIAPLAASAPLRMPPRLLAATLGTGMLGTLAIALYTWATWQQLLAVAVVLAALYPVIPVVLGRTVLKEHINRTQALGLALSAAAIVGIALA
ncbi:EamA family transporter [Nocardia goodfellowii]